MKSAILLCVCLLAGCATEPPPAPIVAPETVKVVGSDFCATMREISGRPDGKLTWSPLDTPKTIHGIRRLAGALDQRRCAFPSTSKPTS